MLSKEINDIFVILSLLLSIIGLIATIKIAFIQKILQFNIFNSELINNKKFTLSKIKFLYDETPVEKLTTSKIVFWNNSFRAIKKKNIPKAAPLTISLKEGKIIEISVLEGNETGNKVSISNTSDTHAIIKFDYLNRKEGGIIQVMHTGNEDSISISGKVIGGKIKTSQEKHTNIHKAVHMILIFLYAYFSFLVFSIIVPPNMISESRRLYLETVPEKYGIINVQNLLFLTAIIMISWVLVFFQEKVINFTPKNCKEDQEV